MARRFLKSKPISICTASTGKGHAQQLQCVISRTNKEITELETKRAQIDATLAELRVVNGSCRALLIGRQRKPESKA